MNETDPLTEFGQHRVRDHAPQGRTGTLRERAHYYAYRGLRSLSLLSGIVAVGVLVLAIVGTFIEGRLLVWGFVQFVVYRLVSHGLERAGDHLGHPLGDDR